MNGFEKMLSKWNFKKIAVIYVTLAVLALIACGVAVGVLYRERIAFAISYSRLEELCEKKNPSEAPAQKGILLTLCPQFPRSRLR